jgi:hypothetical protein
MVGTNIWPTWPSGERESRRVTPGAVPKFGSGMHTRSGGWQSILRTIVS